MAEQAETAAKINRAELEVNEPSEHGTSQLSSVYLPGQPVQSNGTGAAATHRLVKKRRRPPAAIDHQQRKA